jgi:putative transposase
LSVFSDVRGVQLLTISEASDAFQVSDRTIRRALNKPGVYVEDVLVEHPNGTGSTRKKVVDPVTLMVALGRDIPLQPFLAPAEDALEGIPQSAEPSLATPQSTELAVSQAGPPLEVTRRPGTQRTVPNLALVPTGELQRAKRRAELLEPLASLSASDRNRRFRELAESGELGVRSVSSVRRLYVQYHQGREVRGQARAGALALVRPPRADRGKPRIPEALFGLLVQLWLMHPNASSTMLKRVIELNDPTLLTYRKRKTFTLSESTIRRTRSWMERIPELRYALLDADGRSEFDRVWAGEVLTAHACELWMADMTRCDTFVFDEHAPESGYYRLRVHAVIDVYSGAVPAWVFSRQEDQGATDRMLMLAVHPKPGEWERRWPVYGRPNRLYWDNGKVYRSKKSDRLLAELGIEVVHSRPYVSHSRGNIERVFGTFHQDFEKNLPGYAGTDAVDRSSKEIDRLWHNTQRWVRAGGADPYPDRLLTEDEYKQKALAWIVADYHQRTHLGLTRVQHYLDTAPLTNRAQVNFDELMLMFSDYVQRTVEGNGFVRWRNRKWALQDAGLIRWQGQKVVLLINELIPGQEQRKVGVEQPGGELLILGDLVPFSGSALNESNTAYRAAAKTALKELRANAEEIRETLTDPTWRHDRVLERAARLEPTEIDIRPTPRARLTSVNPSDEYAKQLEADRRAAIDEGLKLDWDADVPSPTGRR